MNIIKKILIHDDLKNDSQQSLLRLLIAIIVICFLADSFVHSKTVHLVSPKANPAPQVLHGMQQLEEALIANQWTTERTFGIPSNLTNIDLEIIVTAFDPALANQPGMEILKDVVAPEPESFSVLKFDRQNQKRIYAVGSDPTGALYASLNLVEQIRLNQNRLPLDQAIQDVRKKASIPVRGIKVLLHENALQDPLSWVHSHSYWHGYLNMLAQNRFNYLALEGVYQFSNARYLNLYKYLYSDLQEPSTISAEQAQRIRNSIKRVIELAHERGINVSLNNEWTPGLTPDTRQDGLDHFRENQQVIERMLMDFPLLKGIGMRIHQNGLSLQTSHLSIFQPLISASNKPLLFLKPGPANAESIINTLNQFDGRSVLCVDYNGDFLGQPYQVTGDRGALWNQTSYKNYYQATRKYSYISEIRNSGTHRIFPWGDYAFIKRTLATTIDHQANGFVIEPFSTFSAKTDAYSNNTHKSFSYYEWTFERDWYWYLLWGQLAYHLDKPETAFVKHFQYRFGNQAGETIWQALQNASQVIPAISAFAQKGPQREQFAPELEAPFSIQDILHQESFDPFTVRNIQEESNALQTGLPNAKRSPIDLLDKSTAKAAHAVELLQQAKDDITAITKQSNDLLRDQEAKALQEWEAWKLDFESLAALGASWRDQLKAALAWNLFLYTGDMPSLIMASDQLKRSQAAWQRLQQTTEARYRPLLVTFGQQAGLYHWQENSGPWDQDAAMLKKTYNDWLKQDEWNQGVGHLPVNVTQPDQPIVITYSIPPKVPVDTFFVNYKNSHGDSGQVKMDPSNLDGVYYAQIPSSVVKEGLLRYYFYSRINGKEQEILSPSENAPFITAVTNDTEPPIITDLQADSTTNTVTVQANFSDSSGVYNATLFWKPMPSSEVWQSLPMQRAGSLFKASFPLTNAGVQYAIEVVDHYGNARRVPSANSETPYKTILTTP